MKTASMQQYIDCTRDRNDEDCMDEECMVEPKPNFPDESLFTVTRV